MAEKPTAWSLEYFSRCNKVFWILNRDHRRFQANQIVPCIFVEEKSDKTHHILRFDEIIRDDGFRYTAWRSLLGRLAGVRVQVLLIEGGDPAVLWTLAGTRVEWDDLGTSNVCISREHLAPFGLQ